MTASASLARHESEGPDRHRVKPRGDVSLGDLLRAIAALGLQKKTTDRRAHLDRTVAALGLPVEPKGARTSESDDAEQRTPRPPEGDEHRPQWKPPEERVRSAPPIPEPRDVEETETPRPVRLLRIQSVRTTATLAPWTRANAKPMDEPTAESYRDPEPRPLFEPRLARSILGAVARTRDPSCDIDVEQLADDIAHARPVTELPFEVEWSLRRGLQLLVDRGKGMAPFASDCERIRDDLDAVLADDAFDVQEFEGSPTRGVLVDWFEIDDDDDDDDDDGTAPWTPPVDGRPIVVLSDLGLAPISSIARASSREWREFGERARRAGSPVVCLSPYSTERTRTVAGDAMECFHWDRSTGTSEVARVLRRLRIRGHGR